MIHITGTSAVKVGDYVNGMRLVVNTGFTGTITVTDANGTQAVITNPVVGNFFTYHGLQGAVNVTCSVAGDVTAYPLNREV